VESCPNSLGERRHIVKKVGGGEKKKTLQPSSLLRGWSGRSGLRDERSKEMLIVMPCAGKKVRKVFWARLFKNVGVKAAGASDDTGSDSCSSLPLN